MLQGNTYLKEVFITGNNDVPVKNIDVKKIQFIFDKYEKFYLADGTGEVRYDNTRGCFIVPFSEEETFNLSGNSVKVQVRVMFLDGSIDGSLVNYEIFHNVITETRLTESEEE